MNSYWFHDLYRIGSVTGVKVVVVRMSLAVGVPLVGGVLLGHTAAGVAGGATALFVTMSDIGTTARIRLGTMLAGWIAIVAGGTLGHQLGGTPHGNEIVVFVSAIVAGWASGSHPGIAAVTRYFAIAAAAATGMHFADADVLLGVAVGGASAFVAAFLVWHWFDLTSEKNFIDWRAGVRRAFDGADAGVRYTLCYAMAAAIALFAASSLRETDPFWATLVVLMVMRREGLVSIELNVQYALGTLAGVVVAAGLLHWIDNALALATLATLVAALGRVGFAVNPALGFMSFTMFLLFVVEATLASVGAVPDLLGARIYDVGVGCALALAGTLAATYPRFARRSE